MRAHLLRACLASALLASPAVFGQGGQPLLNLGSAPQAPEAGSGAAALALAQALEREADGLRGQGTRGHARASVRGLAAVLLRTGEAAGAAGSERIVLGLTLARGMGEIDAAIAAAEGPAIEGALELAAMDLDRGPEALSARNGEGSVDVQRTVRDAAAALADALLPATAAPAGRDWGQIQSLSPETAAALESASTLLTEAASHPAYRAAAERLRRVLDEAALAAAAPPPWLPVGARDAIVERVTAAARGLVDPTARAEAAAALERAARLNRLINAADRLEETPAVRKARTQVAEFAAAAPGEADTERIAAAQRILDAAGARLDLPEERMLPRQVRPAWRQLLVQSRQTEAKLLPMVETALTRVDAMSDPAVLSALAAHRVVIDDLRLLERTAARIVEEGPPDREPAVAERWKRVADRLLKLGQDLGRPQDRDAALAGLRELTGQIDRYAVMPGEEELREANQGRGRLAAAWARLTGGKGEALLIELSDRRSGWVQGWDRQGYAGTASDLARLQAIRGLMETLHDAAAADANSETYARLNSTTGWEMSAETLARLAGDLTERCVEATEAMSTGDTEKCNGLVAEIREARAAVLLAGRLARRVMAAPGPALLEACGGGEPPWPARIGGLVAEVCRYGAEPDQAAYANARAKEALAVLGERP